MLDNNFNKVYFLYKKEPNMFDLENKIGSRLIISEGFDGASNTFKHFVSLIKFNIESNEEIEVRAKELSEQEFDDLLFLIEGHIDIIYADSCYEDELDFDNNGYVEELYFDCALYNRLVSGFNIINEEVLKDDFNTDNYTGFSYKGLFAINHCVKLIFKYLNEISFNLNLLT